MYTNLISICIPVGPVGYRYERWNIKTSMPCFWTLELCKLAFQANLRPSALKNRVYSECLPMPYQNLNFKGYHLSSTVYIETIFRYNLPEPCPISAIQAKSPSPHSKRRSWHVVLLTSVVQAGPHRAHHDRDHGPSPGPNVCYKD